MQHLRLLGTDIRYIDLLIKLQWVTCGLQMRVPDSLSLKSILSNPQYSVTQSENCLLLFSLASIEMLIVLNLLQEKSPSIQHDFRCIHMRISLQNISFARLGMRNSAYGLKIICTCTVSTNGFITCIENNIH